MKDLGNENTRLERLVGGLSLEKQIVRDIAEENLYAAARRRQAGD